MITGLLCSQNYQSKFLRTTQRVCVSSANIFSKQKYYVQLVNIALHRYSHVSKNCSAITYESHFCSQSKQRRIFIARHCRPRGVLRISSFKTQNPKVSLDKKLTPQKSNAKSPSLGCSPHPRHSDNEPNTFLVSSSPYMKQGNVCTIPVLFDLHILEQSSKQ